RHAFSNVHRITFYCFELVALKKPHINNAWLSNIIV
ncbi:MAG: hypothetical protein ACI93S_000993, partial [Ancylomarina sp.]